MAYFRRVIASLLGTNDEPIESTDGALNVNVNSNALGLDAWSRNKVIIDKSLVHGVWTREVSGKVWLDRTDGIDNPPETNFTSENGMLKCQGAAGELRYLHSRRHPRYQPNRGHLYSSSMILPDFDVAVNQEFGLISPHSGIFFRVNAGKLYIVRRTSFDSGAGYVTTDYPTEITLPAGYDGSRTKGHLYDIQMQWRGVGDIKIFIDLDGVQILELLGTLDAVSIIDPALPVGFVIDGEAKMYCVCADITSEGGTKENRQYMSASTSNVSGEIPITGYNFPVLAVRSVDEFRNLPNNRDVVLTRVTGYCDKKSVMRVWVTSDATGVVGGTWDPIDSGNMEVNEAMTSIVIAKCKLMLTVRLKGDEQWAVENPDDIYGEFYLTHGDNIIVTIHEENGGIANAGATIELAEEI